MKTFCLRSAFSTSGVNLNKEVTVGLASGTVLFVRSLSLPVFGVNTTGCSPSGKTEVSTKCVEVIFRGHPFLAEIRVKLKVDNSINLWQIRQILTARTEEIAALLNWVHPGILKNFLADALFSRDASVADNDWEWTDVQQYQVTSFRDDPKKSKSELLKQEAALTNLPQSNCETARMAMRWMYRAENHNVLVDKYICYWTALEILAYSIGNGNSINARLLDTLKVLYTGETSMTDKQYRSLRSCLYKARCKILHKGMRDIASITSLIEVALHTARAGVAHLLGTGEPIQLPKQEVLKQLGLRE